MAEWADEIRRRLQGLGLTPADEADLIEELAQDADDEYRGLVSRGMSPGVARDALLASLDDPSLREVAEHRARIRRAPLQPIGEPSRRASIVDRVWHDLWYSWRSLWQSPTFTLAAVASLGLGIGATTAMFSLLNTVFLERLPVRAPGELIAIRTQVDQPANRKGKIDAGRRFLGIADYDWLARNPGGPHAAVYWNSTVRATFAGRSEFQVATDLVSGDFFDLIGVRSLRGRTISQQDAREHARVAVVSEAYWQRHLGADSGVVGSRIDVNGFPVTVIGIMPRSYYGLYFGRAFSIAVPITTAPQLGLPDFRSLPIELIARRVDGESVSQAQQRFQLALGGQDGPSLAVQDISRGISWGTQIRDQYRQVIEALMAGVIILLMIACANVANLLLARTIARQGELALRMSLGASRTRIASQLLTESVELAAMAAVVGVGLAYWGTTLVAHNLPVASSFLIDLVPLRPTLPMIGFVAAATLGCGLVMGLLPVARGMPVDLHGSLAGRMKLTGRRGRVDQVVVGAQVTLALVLLCAAGLFVATLHNLRRDEGGYRTDRILFAAISSRGTRYPDAAELGPAQEPILAAVRAVPGVASAGIGVYAPVISRYTQGMDVRVPDASEVVTAAVVGVMPGYFTAVGAGILAGRDFGPGDSHGNELVGIVSNAFVRAHFGARNPIGETVYLDTLAVHIVGIAGDVHLSEWGADGRAVVAGPTSEVLYLSSPQGKAVLWRTGPYDLVLVARTSGDPSFVLASVRRAITGAAPGINIQRVEGIDATLDALLPRERLAAALASIFGSIALVLAAIGLYGVVSYSVTRRTREIGIRVALGATPTDALWLVLGDTVQVIVAGLTVGVALALAASQLIRGQLFGIEPSDPLVIIGAMLVLGILGVVAAFVPGLRACKVDPIVAMRVE